MTRGGGSSVHAGCARPGDREPIRTRVRRKRGYRGRTGNPRACACIGRGRRGRIALGVVRVVFDVQREVERTDDRRLHRPRTSRSINGIRILRASSPTGPSRRSSPKVSGAPRRCARLDPSRSASRHPTVRRSVDHRRPRRIWSWARFLRLRLLARSGFRRVPGRDTGIEQSVSIAFARAGGVNTGRNLAEEPSVDARTRRDRAWSGENFGGRVEASAFPRGFGHRHGATLLRRATTLRPRLTRLVRRRASLCAAAPGRRR